MSSLLLRIDRVDHRDSAVAERIHAVQMQAYAQEARLLGAQDFPPLRVTTVQLQASEETFIAAFLDDELVGAISTEPDPDGKGTVIASLVVAPRAQRQGIARRLLAQALAAHRGDRITVQTGAGNVPALHLYARSGFTEIARWFTGPEPLEIVQLRHEPR